MKNRKGEIRIKQSKHYRRNDDARESADGEPCIICGKACLPGTPMLWAHHGSLEFVVTKERGEELSKTAPGTDMGCWPIGPDCLKKNPKLKDFLVRIK